MLFVDDLLLFDESRDNIEERLEDQTRQLESVGLKVRKSKTEYLPPKEGSDDIKLQEYVSSEHATLPQKVTFKYLGPTIHQEGECRTEVWRKLNGMLCDQKAPKNPRCSFTRQ